MTKAVLGLGEMKALFGFGEVLHLTLNRPAVVGHVCRMSEMEVDGYGELKGRESCCRDKVLR